MKTKRTRAVPLTIKVSKEEKRMLVAVCKALDATQSDYIRYTIRGDYEHLLPVIIGGAKVIGDAVSYAAFAAASQRVFARHKELFERLAKHEAAEREAL